MNVNWSGLGGEDLQDALAFLDDKELLGGIVGSTRRSPRGAVFAHRGVRLSLPDAPAHPGRLRVPLAGHRRPARKTRRCRRSPGKRTPAIAERITMPDLFYCSASSHPGAVTLHNYPKHLQNLRTRRRRTPGSGGGGHLPRPRTRRPAIQQLPAHAAQAAGQVVRRADRQPRVAQAAQGGLQQRPRERSI